MKVISHVLLNIDRKMLVILKNNVFETFSNKSEIFPCELKDQENLFVN